MSTIITLTTDFGLTDAYVAAMKGVILSFIHSSYHLIISQIHVILIEP